MTIRFNSKGDCLLNKQSAMSINSELKHKLKELYGITFPQKVKTFDSVEIGHNYTPKDNNTKILSFRDINGKLVQRNIIKTTPNSTTHTKKNYLEMPLSRVRIETDDSFTSLGIKGRKISSVTKQDGRYVSKSEEIQTFCPSGLDCEPVVTISKTANRPFLAGLECEQKSVFEYTKYGKKGFATNEYAKSKGQGIDVNGIKYEYTNMQSIENDRYLPLHFYSFSNFKRTAPHIVENPEHKPPNTFIEWYSKHPDDTISYGSCVHRGNGSFYDIKGNVRLNKKANTTNADIINTTAHEKEHAYQQQQMEHKKVLDALKTKQSTKYEGKYYTLEDVRVYEEQNGRKFVDSETEADKYIRADEEYVSFKEDSSAYKRNYLEKMANVAAKNAEKEYQQSVKNLRSNFQYAPDYQIGHF